MTEKTVIELGLTKERKESDIFGIVLFILDSQNRVFVVKENSGKDNTHRKAGEFSVICETREPGEGWLENIRRALKEEAGVPDGRFGEVIDFSDRAIWETGFVDKVWATAMKVRCINSELLLEFAKSSNEIEAVGWKTRSELEKLQLREGVKNILDKFSDRIFGK